MKPCTRKWIFITGVALTFVYFVYAFFITPSKSMWMPRYLKKTISPRRNTVLKFPQTRSNSNKISKILLWTTWFKSSLWHLNFKTAFRHCDFTDCTLSNDKRDLKDSDALVFHLGDMPIEYTAGYMPTHHRPEQVWIVQNSEPTTNIRQDLSSYKYVFNWTATYRKDSDVYMPYLNTKKLKERKGGLEDVASSKSKGIAWVASNCGDHARRQMYVRELRKYIAVDTFGECGDEELSRSSTGHVLSKYKFYLAFESAYCVDYVTEKFASALSRHQIPVVSGAADYESIAPPNSYINVLDFESVQDLARYLHYLDSNDTAYNQYFKWTMEYELDMFYMQRGMCEICRRLHDVTMTLQVYPDIDGYFRQDTCPIWTYIGNKYRSIQGWLIHFRYV